MGDRTTMQVIIYDCPPHRVNAVLKVLEDRSLDPHWGFGGRLEGLELCTVYGEHEVYGDASEEVANELQAAAPEATFLTWTDPKYDWLGSLVAYAPDLGEFFADCDAEGLPQFTEFNLRTLLENHRDKTVAQFLDEVHPRSTGALWFRRFEELMERNKDVVIARGPEEED